MDSETILLDKEGFKFILIQKKNYKLTFSMENNFIYMPKIIDFNLIKLIYELNPDVYDKIEVNIDPSGNEAIAVILMKHFFEDLGLSQKYSFIHMKRLVEENKILFKSNSITSHRPKGLPDHVEQMAIEDFNSVCDIITPHKISFTFNIKFNSEVLIPQFAEKMVGTILFKIFKRVKQFIENIRL